MARKKRFSFRIIQLPSGAWMPLGGRSQSRINSRDPSCIPTSVSDSSVSDSSSPVNNRSDSGQSTDHVLASSPSTSNSSWQDIKSNIEAKINKLIIHEMEGGASSTKSLRSMIYFKLLMDTAGYLASKKKSPSNWVRVLIPFALLLMGLFLVGLSIWLRKSETEVYVSAVVSGFSASVNEDARLFERMDVEGLDFGGISKARLPGENMSLHTLHSKNFGLGVDRDTKGGKASSIRLEPVDIKNRTWFSVVKSKNSAGRIDVAIDRSMVSSRGLLDVKNADVLTELWGSVSLKPSIASEYSVSLEQPLSLEVWGEPGVTIALLYGNRVKPLFCVTCNSIFISTLDFNIKEEQRKESSQSVASSSSIISGSILFSELDKKEVQLRRGDRVSMVFQEGDLLSSRIINERGDFEVSFHGTVSRITIGRGSHEQEKDLIPTWLEWFSTNKNVAMIWAATAFMITMFYTVNNAINALQGRT